MDCFYENTSREQECQPVSCIRGKGSEITQDTVEASGTVTLCVGAAAQCRALQKAGKNNGYCDGYHHDTKGLGKTSGQTATHVFGSFPITVWLGLYHLQWQPSVYPVAPEDGPTSCRPASAPWM
jgi:hypothetical protein